MKTNFYVPRKDYSPSNFSLEFYDCSLEANKDFLINLLSSYKEKRSQENYKKERLEYTFHRISNALIVYFKKEVVLVVCIAIHNNWILLTRAVKFKYWKEPMLLGLCMEHLLDFQIRNGYNGIFLTFNKHNLDYLKATFDSSRYKYRNGWMVDNMYKYSSIFEYDLKQTVFFNGVEQYLVKTKSSKELIL